MYYLWLPREDGGKLILSPCLIFHTQIQHMAENNQPPFNLNLTFHTRRLLIMGKRHVAATLTRLRLKLAGL